MENVTGDGNTSYHCVAMGIIITENRHQWFNSHLYVFHTLLNTICLTIVDIQSITGSRYTRPSLYKCDILYVVLFTLPQFTRLVHVFH